MSNEGTYKMFMGHVARIEKEVDLGGDGFEAFQELVDEINENRLGDILTAKKIVQALSQKTKDILLTSALDVWIEER